MSKQSLNEHEVYAHGKLVKIYVSPIKEALYKLRPKLEGETGKDRVAKVEAAEQAIVEAVEGLIIGKDESEDPADFYLSLVHARNELRAKQRKSIKEWQ